MSLLPLCKEDRGGGGVKEGLKDDQLDWCVRVGGEGEEWRGVGVDRKGLFAREAEGEERSW